MLLGIDVGTSGARALLVDDRGRVLQEAVCEVPLHTPRPGWAEQHPEDWWNAARSVLDQVSAGHSIRAIGLSGQMHGVALLDSAGQVLAPAQIWCDSRCYEECREITARVGAERLVELTANPALVGFSAPKLMWARKHQPEVWTRVRHFLLPKDFVRYRLTGELATEVSDASGTLLFDVVNRRWSAAMSELLQVPSEWLPPSYESPQATTRTADGVPVVGGGGDQAAGAVGAGIVEPGLVSLTLGSSGVVFAHAEQPQRDPQGRVHTFCHAVPGAWHVMGVTQAAGLSLRWFRDQFAPQASYEELLARAEPSSQGLLFLPYLMGERTPHLDPHARGVFCGLSAAHSLGHMVRALLEGIAFSMRDCLEVFAHMGVPAPESVRIAGGGARSSLWRQIHADVLGVPVTTLQASEGPAYGAALLAGVGTGLWSSVPEACRACVRPEAVTEPRESGRYEEAYRLYRQTYQALRPLFPHLGAAG